ncbi:transposon Tf2-6 polyprotein [Trichonephila clavipes]|uniref:RNA-directed DNA polymerase n=1 Tax=Trichonephila clavipes TaxID=2585209 RepID=A0A8X6RT91_TRICX|nr:transposon Tf2-6 polyprotein [Trichonephila clavipes]
MEQQIADLLRQNQDLIRALQIRDDSHSHKVTVQFDKFDEENENFDSFLERFETYLDVQNVPIANRAKVFVSSLNAKLYQLLKNLLAPDIPSDQTLDKLKDALKKHLVPKPLIIPSRHKFLNRKQTEGEGISTYIAELRALAMNCDYDKDMLNIMLRDVFVALKDRVENEIDRLEKEGIIEKVDSSEWATPVVPVVKSDGSIRLCADYSVTLNPNLIVPQHPLPRLDEIFGSLNGGKQFTKLDFKHAYLQMKVHPDTSDASPVGIGCVLSHVYPDGSERPIAFASRTLSGSEKKYSQIDKEALSIVWASFEFDIIFRKTIDHGNADFLSRLPKTSEELAVKDDITIFQMSQIEALPVTSKELRQETSKDIELGPLLRALREGKDLQGREAQYTIEDGCIMYGQRVCIPRKFRKNVLEELHAGHLGIVKMKAIARSFVYWKNIDNDIEEAAKTVSIVLDIRLILQNLKFITGNIPVCPGNVFM